MKIKKKGREWPIRKQKIDTFQLHCSKEIFGRCVERINHIYHEFYSRA